jgi:glycosyltransferase involved in cell wall biosynthesis
MRAPAVSVIIPCYNGGRFLDGLLSNLRAQTFRDFEILIIDDGSTEPETLIKLAEVSSDVQLVQQPNAGLAAARNTGFRNARAEMVLPLDCDDILEASFLAETVRALERAPAEVGFVFTHMRLTGALEGVFKTKFDRFDQLFFNHLPYCMLFRKSAWAAVGGYDETMRGGDRRLDGSEDWEFNIRLAKANFRGVEIARSLFVYSVRPEGMLLSKTARLQGTMWQRIRSRHKELYQLSALIKVWREENRSWSSALRALVLLVLVRSLPERGYNALCFRFMGLARGWRMRRGHFKARV